MSSGNRLITPSSHLDLVREIDRTSRLGSVRCKWVFAIGDRATDPGGALGDHTLASSADANG